MKEILIYVFLGIVQGLTEPLPISSSGHVFVLKKLLGITASDLNFEIVVNFGSLLAILLIYKEDLIRLIKNFFMYFKVTVLLVVFTEHVAVSVEYEEQETVPFPL